VAADCTHLPFRPESFSHAVASEVLEHIPDDRAAVREIARVLKPRGRFILTFPHRKAYFTYDDRYVKHYRRYELEEAVQLLSEAELTPLSTQNVLGPIEKITMMTTIFCFEHLVKLADTVQLAKPHATMHLLSPVFRFANWLYAGLLRFEARIVPQRWAAVLLTVAEKK